MYPAVTVYIGIQPVLVSFSPRASSLHVSKYQKAEEILPNYHHLGNIYGSPTALN